MPKLRRGHENLTTKHPKRQPLEKPLSTLTFAPFVVGLAQLVRAPDCGSGGRGFDPHSPPLLIGRIRSGPSAPQLLDRD